MTMLAILPLLAIADGQETDSATGYLQWAGHHEGNFTFEIQLRSPQPQECWFAFYFATERDELGPLFLTSGVSDSGWRVSYGPGDTGNVVQVGDLDVEAPSLLGEVDDHFIWQSAIFSTAFEGELTHNIYVRNLALPGADADLQPWEEDFLAEVLGPGNTLRIKVGCEEEHARTVLAGDELYMRDAPGMDSAASVETEEIPYTINSGKDVVVKGHADLTMESDVVRIFADNVWATTLGTPTAGALRLGHPGGDEVQFIGLYQVDDFLFDGGAGIGWTEPPHYPYNHLHVFDGGPGDYTLDLDYAGSKIMQVIVAGLEPASDQDALGHILA